MQPSISTDDWKMYGFNSLVMFLSFTNIEAILKIVLLLASIVYTIMKIVELYKDKKKKKS
jgi:hypothetical protein